MGARLVLASRSPQRRAILEQLGIEFEVVVPDVDELGEGDAAAVVVENARRKTRAIGRPEEVVLGVDTAVVLGDRIFGKPADAREAARVITRLSGRAHEVHSGIVLAGPGGERVGRAVTRVEFRDLDADVVDWYVGTGEWRERAGGYAIQGRGAALVERVEGDFWNVVGLPVAELFRLAPELLAAVAPAR